MNQILLEIATERYVDEVLVTIVKVAGRLDGATYPLFVNAVRRLVESGERHLVFDLQSVDEIGSAGLIALHQASRLIRGERPIAPDSGWSAFHALEHDLVRGQSLGIKVLRPSAAVIDLMVASGFAALVEPYASVDSAAASFRRSQPVIEAPQPHLPRAS